MSPSLPPDGTLVVDVGGQTVKLTLDSDNWIARLPSGPDFTPQDLVASVRAAADSWSYAQVSIGLPMPVKDDRSTLEPHNLGPGWLAYDLRTGFDVPTKVVNDAVMQALGSYDGGKMLFLGFGTGLGAALVVEDAVIGLELAHMPYKDDLTFEDFAGSRGLERLGADAWLVEMSALIATLRAGVVADYVVLGGGNAVRLDPLPTACRQGRNEYAIRGGRRLWLGPVRIY